MKEYLAIIFIGGGSSWASADTAYEAITKVKKYAEDDWGKICKFTDDIGTIDVYDYTNATGFYADYRGVFDKGTHLPLTYLYGVTARLKNKPVRSKK